MTSPPDPPAPTLGDAETLAALSRKISEARELAQDLPPGFVTSRLQDALDRSARWLARY